MNAEGVNNTYNENNVDNEFNDNDMEMNTSLHDEELNNTDPQNDSLDKSIEKITTVSSPNISEGISSAKESQQSQSYISSEINSDYSKQHNNLNNNDNNNHINNNDDDDSDNNHNNSKDNDNDKHDNVNNTSHKNTQTLNKINTVQEPIHTQSGPIQKDKMEVASIVKEVSNRNSNYDNANSPANDKVSPPAENTEHRQSPSIRNRLSPFETEFSSSRSSSQSIDEPRSSPNSNSNESPLRVDTQHSLSPEDKAQHSSPYMIPSYRFSEQEQQSSAHSVNMDYSIPPASRLRDQRISMSTKSNVNSRFSPCIVNHRQRFSPPHFEHQPDLDDQWLPPLRNLELLLTPHNHNLDNDSLPCKDNKNRFPSPILHQEHAPHLSARTNKRITPNYDHHQRVLIPPGINQQRYVPNDLEHRFYSRNAEYQKPSLTRNPNYIDDLSSSPIEQFGPPNLEARRYDIPRQYSHYPAGYTHVNHYPPLYSNNNTLSMVDGERYLSHHQAIKEKKAKSKENGLHRHSYIYDLNDNDGC
eukprot:TRINITY_DN4695_c0_g1_i1.p1 TRINITY_DN4695_c0_g1~~TRINITY_DN4695_c0_g1_i1.p1  ORF type:complete len:595 (+),score=83.44 TRINITY_DN4695_c0_g1_i1:203-1786(+)